MPPPKLPRHVAKRFVFLLLLGVVLLVVEQTAEAQQPAKQPVELKLRWELEVKNAPPNVKLIFDREGANLILQNWVRHEAISLNARTAKPGSELPVDQSSVGGIFTLEGGKVAYQAGNGAVKTYTLWDIPSGKVTNPPYAIETLRLQHLRLSANGRYTACYENAPNVKPGDQFPETPLRIFDSKAGKITISTDWKTGRVLFTPDASRILTVDASDNFRWLKLPSGQPDGEWKFDRQPHMWNARVHSMSADGRVIVYSGTPPKQANNSHGLYLIDGKTGDILHKYSTGMYPEREAMISPEGDMLVLVRADGPIKLASEVVEVLDAKGAVLAKVKSPMNTPFTWSASWETRSLAIYSPELKKLWMYDLPGASSSAVVVSRPKRDPGSDRAPVPGDVAVAKAEATIRQVLKDDYAKKTVADQKVFAQKLIKLAAETTDDPASRYVMLRDALDLAQNAADPTLTLQAIDVLARLYQVDGPVQQLASLEKILAASALPATAKIIAETATVSAQAAADDDAFDEAVDFAQLASNAAKKAKFTGATLDEIESNLTLAKKARDAFTTLRPALEKLKTTPDDPAANTLIGKYRCFNQNRWDEGLKHLSKGEDAALGAVAELDLKTPRTGALEDAKLADAWWEYAQVAPADMQWAAQARTRYWYGRTIPVLTGLNKARAETRLAITVAGVEYRPGLIAEFSSRQPAILKGKKAKLDSTIDFSGGEFSDTKAADLTTKWTGVLAPQRGGRYTIAAQTTDQVRVKIDGKIVIDTTQGGGTPKREASVTLGEKVTPIVVEHFGQNSDKHKLRLSWTAPGSTTDELIPAECLFHDRKAESVLGK